MASLEVEDDTLQAPDHKGSSLSCTGLRLTNGVPTIQNRFDSSLLDRTRLLEAVGVDPTQQLLIEVVVVEGLED